MKEKFTTNLMKGYIYKNEPIITNLIQAMELSLENYRRGLLMTEFIQLLKGQVYKYFKTYLEPTEGEAPTEEQKFFYKLMVTVDYHEIAVSLYDVIYKKAQLLRITQNGQAVDTAYNKMNEAYEDNEENFFENEFLKIFQDKYTDMLDKWREMW